MIQLLIDAVVVVALGVYLALMGEHRPLPEGLFWSGGRVMLGDRKSAS